MGFGRWVSGLALRFSVANLGFGGLDLGFRIWGLGFRVKSSMVGIYGFQVTVQNLRFRI